MANKLSFSQVNMYSQCGHKYKLHYKDGLREKFFHSALAYGSAIDAGLNTLLETRNLEKARESFLISWSEQYINGVKTQLHDSVLLVYAEKDFDYDLIPRNESKKLCVLAEDIIIKEIKFKSIIDNMMMNREILNLSLFLYIKEQKETYGFDNLSDRLKSFYNNMNWACLREKGLIMIDSYNKKVMPKVKNVLAVQHKFKLQNDDGDEIVAVADMVVEWFDGRILLLDNKTSARMYEDDQATRSQQLIIYYHKLKEDFNLTNQVGFIVMNKNILKNKKKTCSVCNFDGSGGRAHTCNQMNGKIRCNGAWIEEIDPECFIQEIINPISEVAEELVLSSFDQANQGIKNEYYYKNLSACKQGALICPFYRVCWKNDYSGVVDKNNIDSKTKTV